MTMLSARENNPHLAHLTFRRSWLLALASLFVVAAVACGSDDGAQNSDDGVAAASFQASNDSITWSPPWEEGDVRTIEVDVQVEPSAAIQELMERAESSVAGPGPELLPESESGTVGTVGFSSVTSSGAVGRFDLALEELLSKMQDMQHGQPGFGETDFDGASVLLAFVDQLDLGVEFGIDDSGAVTEVTNLDDLAAEVQGLFGSLMKLAALAGEEADADEDIAMLENLLAEFPKTETAQLMANSAINVATANLFLMRSGEYALNEPVVVSGNAPAIMGLATDGTLTFELTAIDDSTATIDVVVEPADVDLFQLMLDSADELAPLLGGDAGEFASDARQASDRERAQFDMVTGLLFEPYTVTLTLDVATGWVAAADWTVELAFPENLDEVLEDDDDAFEELSPEDFGVTITGSAAFS